MQESDWLPRQQIPREEVVFYLRGISRRFSEVAYCLSQILFWERLHWRTLRIRGLRKFRESFLGWAGFRQRKETAACEPPVTVAGTSNSK